MSEPIFVMRFDAVPGWGEPGEYELTKLTRSSLSLFKRWYGQEYGQRLTVITKAMFEDSDAVGCLVYACRKENGLEVVEPIRMPDFDPADVFVVRSRVKCPTCGGTGVDPDSVASGDVPLGETKSESTKTSHRSGSTTETLTSSTTDGSQE